MNSVSVRFRGKRRTRRALRGTAAVLLVNTEVLLTQLVSRSSCRFILSCIAPRCLASPLILRPLPSSIAISDTVEIDNAVCRS